MNRFSSKYWLSSSSANQTYTLGTLGDNLYSVSGKCKDREGAFKLIQFLLDEQAIKERTADGKIIPIKNFKSDNEVTNEVIEYLGTTAGVQLWYDQYLPAEVAEVHKTTSQEVFGLTKDASQVNKEMQDAMTAYLGK